MRSRLTGSQRIRLDREILTSGVTMSSRESTRHRNAAEQTLLEQKLHDLDLQRRKSIQAISTEREKSLQRFLKTNENNKLKLDKSSTQPRKNSLNHMTSKTKKTFRNDESSIIPKIVSKSPRRTQNKAKLITRNISTKKPDDTSSIYDAYLSYTPSFLLEEYKKEELLAEMRNQQNDVEHLGDGLCNDSPNWSIKRHSICDPDAQSLISLKRPQTSDSTTITPRRRRAQSLHVMSEGFPPNIPGSTLMSHNTLLRTGRGSNLNRRNNSLPDTKNDGCHSFNPIPGPIESRNNTHFKDHIYDDDASGEVETPRRLSEPPFQAMATVTLQDLVHPTLSRSSTSKRNSLLKLTPEGTLQVTSPTDITVDIDRVSKSSQISDWLGNPRDVDRTQPRRMSICTDKLHYKDTDTFSEEDSITALGSSQRYFKGDSHISCINEFENSLPNNSASKGHLCSSATIKMDVNHDRMAPNLLLRRRSSDKNDKISWKIPDGSSHVGTTCGDRSAMANQNIHIDKIMFRKGRQGSIENDLYATGNNGRGGILSNINGDKTENSSTNYLDEESGKMSRIHTKKNLNCESLVKTVSFDNCLSDANKDVATKFNDSRTKQSVSKDVSNGEIVTGSSDERKEEEEEEEKEDEEEDRIILPTAENGRGFPRGKQLLKKILLEASAKQLTFCLKRLGEESGKTAADDKFRISSAKFTQRGSFGETDSKLHLGEPQHDAEEISLRATPTSATPRRPSGSGNFFLVASALKSGQPLNKINFRRDRNCRRSISSVPSDHPCAVADYDSRTTSVQRLADAHALLQRSAMCMVDKDKDIDIKDVFG